MTIAFSESMLCDKLFSGVIYEGLGWLYTVKGFEGVKQIHNLLPEIGSLQKLSVWPAEYIYGE